MSASPPEVFGGDAVIPPPPLERAGFVFLVLFLLVFPKGGIVLGGIPVTWGYVGLGALSLTFGVALVRGTSGALSRSRLIVLGLLAPFQLVSWASFLFLGVESVAWVVSFVVSLFFLPTVFLLAFGHHLDHVDLRWLFRLMRRGVFCIAVYGIALFIFKLTTGSFIEIPLLTVNLADVGTLEDKHIDRGGIFKLISTYNNGNLYGISVLILLPLYSWMERSKFRLWVVKGSLVLTLSRTVWIGLILAEMLQRLYVRRPTIRAVLFLVGSLIAVAVGVWYTVVHILGLDPGVFLLDTKLGGRASQLDVFERASVFPAIPFLILWEIVYLSILEYFGVIGLFTFVAALVAPVVLHLSGGVPEHRSEYKRALASGLMVYVVIAMADAGMLNIPVMAFFWFIVSLLVSNNPTWRGAAARRPAGTNAT